ncbi:ferritin heavy chain-like [Perognathus longimembris pacificus]|uniref:ferritin heavy chain-like n=1 Tax=Perognathus longimembris pacificus TaxID=214514 RepID=UPI002018C50C|nr:ferritin heavy chain-like [Perognathus longimembris pacificus]
MATWVPTSSLLSGQNYHPDCELAVNNQIQLQLYASYVYLSMAFYCGRDDVALEHFSSFFLRQSHKWKACAEKLLKMQNERGGRMCLRDIAAPDRSNWQGGLQTLESSFHLEMTIAESLLDLYHVANSRGDRHLCSFLKQNFLQQQLDILSKLECFLKNLREVWALGEGIAEYLLDRLTLGAKDQKS